MGKITIIENCKLCGSSEKLQRSHVIPNAYFKKLKRQTGYAIQGEITDGVPTRKSQESWHEKLLCRECEQLIGQWERYAISFTTDANKVKIRKHRSGRICEFSGMDYIKFRLFQLSILFRAAIAEGREYYYIRIADQDLNELRHILLSQQEPDPERFGCQMHLLWNPKRNSPFSGFVGIPVLWRIRMGILLAKFKI